MSHHWSSALPADACSAACIWARRQPSYESAWRRCGNGEWMLWLLARAPGMTTNRRRNMVLVGCECARWRYPCESLDPIADAALQVTEAWSRGAVSLAAVREAREALRSLPKLELLGAAGAWCILGLMGLALGERRYVLNAWELIAQTEAERRGSADLLRAIFPRPPALGPTARPLFTRIAFAPRRAPKPRGRTTVEPPRDSPPEYTVAELVSRTRLRNLGHGASLLLQFSSLSGATTVVVLRAPDRDTGEMCSVHTPECVTKWFMTEKEWLRHIRKQLIRAVTHEVDEALHFDNRRPFDPHRRESP